MFSVQLTPLTLWLKTIKRQRHTEVFHGGDTESCMVNKLLQLHLLIPAALPLIVHQS